MQLLSTEQYRSMHVFLLLSRGMQQRGVGETSSLQQTITTFSSSGPLTFSTKAWIYTKKLKKKTDHCESDDCIELVAKQLVKSLPWEMSIIMV